MIYALQKGKFAQNVLLTLFSRDKLANHSVTWDITKIIIKFVNLAKY